MYKFEAHLEEIVPVYNPLVDDDVHYYKKFLEEGDTTKNK